MYYLLNKTKCLSTVSEGRVGESKTLKPEAHHKCIVFSVKPYYPLLCIRHKFL